MTSTTWKEQKKHIHTHTHKKNGCNKEKKKNAKSSYEPPQVA